MTMVEDIEAIQEMRKSWKEEEAVEREIWRTEHERRVAAAADRVLASGACAPDAELDALAAEMAMRAIRVAPLLAELKELEGRFDARSSRLLEERSVEEDAWSTLFKNQPGSAVHETVLAVIDLYEVAEPAKLRELAETLRGEA